MIIDSHVHFGKNSPWGDFEVDFLLNLIEEVDFAICSNGEKYKNINKTQYVQILRV